MKLNRSPVVILAVLLLALAPAGETSPPPNAASIVFPRQGSMIPFEQAKALIAEDLDGRGYDGERVDTFSETGVELAFLPGETGFRISSPNGAARLGPVSFYIETLTGDHVSRTLPVTVWVQLFREQVVTRNAIVRGQPITPADVALTRVEVNGPADDGFSSIEECAGQRARRTLPAGWSLLSRDLERIPAVKRGMKTTVHYRQGGITAIATVEVKADGWVGDAVPVVNVDSKRGFTARVTGPGLLEAGE